MLDMKIPLISYALLVSAIVLPNIQASPLPPTGDDVPVDRTPRSFPSNTQNNVNQLEATDSKAVNNTGSVSGSEEFTTWHQEQRNINKKLRINAIKEYVLRSLLGPQERPPLRINKDALMNRLSSPFSGQLQTFYASCDSPANVDVDDWTSPSFFHIYFNVSSTSSTATPTPQQVPQNRSSSTMVSHEYIPVSNSRGGTIRKTSGQYHQTVNIISAKLRLYKTGHGGNHEAPKFEALNPSEPCNDTDTSAEIVPTVFPSSMELPAQGLPTPDERIRVTVYWYTAPLTKNHYKRKLLDTKMMSVKDSKWVDFDIQRAAKNWLDRKVNYGLVVEVENEDNDIVDARNYFSNLPCELIKGARNNSGSSTEADETRSVTGSTSAPSTAQTMEILPPPVVEICTLTVPNPPRNAEFETTSFFPFPFPMNPSGFPGAVNSPRQTVPQPPINQNDLWQNDDLTTANNNSNQHQAHHHRHNHGRNKNRNQHKKNNSRNQQFKLDDDHPLRQILATAPSSVNSRENRRNLHRSNSNPRLEDQINTEDDIYVDDQNDDGKNREIIIQKIYITPPQSSTKNNNEGSSENLDR